MANVFHIQTSLLSLSWHKNRQLSSVCMALSCITNNNLLCLVFTARCCTTSMITLVNLAIFFGSQVHEAESNAETNTTLLLSL